MIRTASESDVSSVKNIVEMAYKIYLPRLLDPPDPLKQDFSSLVADGKTYVLDVDRGIMGTVTCIEDQNALVMRSLGVDPGHQRRGYGEQLVTFVESEARRRGHGYVRFWTREEMVEARRFYLHLGYEVTGKVKTETRSTVFFEKLLD